MQLHKDKLLANSILEGFCRQNDKSNLINHIDILHLYAIPKIENSSEPIAIGCDIEIYAQFSPLECLPPIKGMKANQICLDAHIDFQNCYYNEAMGAFEWVGNEMSVDQEVHVFYGSGHTPENSMWCETDFAPHSKYGLEKNTDIINTIIGNVFEKENQKFIDFNRALFDKAINTMTENCA